MKTSMKTLLLTMYGLALVCFGLIMFDLLTGKNPNSCCILAVAADLSAASSLLYYSQQKAA